MRATSRAVCSFGLTFSLIALSFTAQFSCGGDDTGGETPPADDPSAPTVTSPAANADVLSPINVVGTGEASATINVSIKSGATEIGTGTGTASSGGAFDFDVTYTDAVGGTVLTVTVTQSVNSKTSAATTVSVTQLGPSAAPTVTSPTANDGVSSPINVVGTGDASATINVSVNNGATEIGAGSGTASSSGAFDFTVTYTEPASDTALTVSVTQTLNTITSDATTVSVTQLALFTLSGDIDQTSGDNSGTVVKVWLYTSATEILNYVKEQTLTATDGSDLAATAFSFDVPNGNYYIRAFRDAFGPIGPADGYPTVGSGGDPQVAATAVTINNGNSTGNNISLIAATSNDMYGFDAFTANESFEAEPPWYDAGGNNWVSGDGLCGGYYMRLEAWRSGTNLTAPMARLPDGSDVELLDDGGCGDTVHDNTSQSYDWGTGDDSFSRGIPNPGNDLAGDFVFSFRNTVDDFIHIEADNIGTIVKLNRIVPLTSPTGAVHVSTRTPTLNWAAVTGAVSYQVDMWWDGGNFGQNTSTNSFTVPGGTLPDNTAIAIAIGITDAAGGGDMDAAARGTANYFVVDVNGNDVMTVSGSITNDSGQTAPILVYASGNRQGGNGPEWQASIVLASDATSYSLEVLEDTSNCPNADNGELVAMIDVDGSGERYSSGNEVFQARVGFDACGTDPAVAIVFRPSINVLTPIPDATSVGDTPLLSWEGYATTYQTATGDSLPAAFDTWSYLIFMGSENSVDMPEIIWGLPNTATQFDMANPPATNDKYDIANFNDSSNPNATSLSGGSVWEWGIGIVNCNFDPPNFTAYETCVTILLGGDEPEWLASSPEMEITP